MSVIVPVRDNPEGIRALLDQLGSQTLPREAFEIVIGDDGSQDASASDCASADDRVRVEVGPPRTSYAARNRAARAARGRILAFTDSDCLPDPEWLERGCEALARADVAAGEVTFTAPETPTVWSLLTVDMYLDQARNVRLTQAVTANLFVSRAMFETVGGFDESLPSSGDYDFARRCVEAGGRLEYAADAVVRHPTLDTARAFLRKVHATTYWATVRRARAGARLSLPGVLSFVPVLGVGIVRRRALQPLVGLPRDRLELAGLQPTRLCRVQAVLTFYFAVAPVGGAAAIAGWWRGRRLARPPVGGLEHEPQPTTLAERSESGA